MTDNSGSIRQITVQELKALREAQPSLELWDVRTEAERARARIEGAKLLDAAGIEDIEELPRDTLLVFQCHHGIRSHSAAAYFASKGFTNVCNVIGGIEAWSLHIDASVPRY